MKERGNNRSDRKTIHKKLHDECKEKIGCRQLREETLDRTVWKTRFGKCYGLVVRQTTEYMKVRIIRIIYFV